MFKTFILQARLHYDRILRMKSQLKDVLNKVHQGKLSPKEALLVLKDFPYQDLGFAKIDHHRELRKGFPEIIYGMGKTDEQILKIAQEITKKGSRSTGARLQLG